MTKLPLKKFKGKMMIDFETKAVSIKHAKRQVIDAVRAIFKTVKITNKCVKEVYGI